MIEVKCCQFFELGLILATIGLNNVLQKLLHLRDVVNENLDNVFDSDSLFFFQLIVLVGI